MENIFNKEQIVQDFKDVVTDTEALLKVTANTGGEKMAEVRTKVEESLKIVKLKLTDIQCEALVRGKQLAKAGDTYVHDNPWRSVGLAASIGIVIGLLIGRR